MVLNIDGTKKVKINDAKHIKAKVVKPKKKINKKIILLFVLIALCVGGYFAYKTLAFSNDIGVKFGTGDLINSITKTPELKKDTTGKYTSALIVGIDTRGGTSQLRNTDSMIIATYNHDTKNLTMISIPRDFYVQVPNEGWYTKINAIYAHGESLKKGNGINYLATTLTGVTGISIQYKAMVDLTGFKKIIDAVGGVTVNVENSFTDYRYPTEQKGKPVYETVSFKKGPQVMNGETALKYARSRKSFDFEEGTDFARAERQQRVIEALKNKIVSSETLLNPQKVMDIMDAIQDNVKLTGVDLSDIQAGIALAKKYKESPGNTYNFVIQPSFGQSQVVKRGQGTLYTIVPVAGANNYTGIKALVKLCLTKPEIYDENPMIRIYDIGLGNAATKAKADAIKVKYPYLNITYMGTLYSGKTGTIIYGHDSIYKGSVDELNAYLKGTSTTKPDYITSNLNNENVTILFGKAVVPTNTSETAN